MSNVEQLPRVTLHVGAPIIAAIGVIGGYCNAELCLVAQKSSEPAHRDSRLIIGGVRVVVVVVLGQQGVTHPECWEYANRESDDEY